MGGSKDGCNGISKHNAIEHFYMEEKELTKYVKDGRRCDATFLTKWNES
jgi:hypothetical protein